MRTLGKTTYSPTCIFIQELYGFQLVEFFIKEPIHQAIYLGFEVHIGDYLHKCTFIRTSAQLLNCVLRYYQNVSKDHLDILKDIN